MRRLKKELGQHILVSGGVLRRLVEFLEVSEGDTVVEVGGGTGNLTRELLRTRLGRLVTLEVDGDMVKELRKIEDNRLTVLEADATAFDLCSLGENVKVIGNLPYNVASLILENTVRCRSCVPLAIFTFQKEVALKLTGKTEPGWLTLFVHTFYRVEYMMSIPPKFFFPKPRVESGVVRLRRREDAGVGDLISYKRFLTRVFSGKKKKIKNLIPQDIVNRAGIDPDLRPHQLSLEEILRLYNVLER
ncbi:MAG: 16S rRNA (adenine(1518)-N(6)/adenine(1519)-N(6))-dimethyltransferase RsmA [Aquificota bacterium]|nr:16S rRNA (adenine(1518)-N(6)/adenine(1519)-N(6))-dimethyltransferase RsmA [Aquificota bacterium]